MRGRNVLAWALVLTLLAGGGAAVVWSLADGSGPAPSAPVRSAHAGDRRPDVVARPRVYPSYTAIATVPMVAVHDRPEGRTVYRLGNPQPLGSTLTFLVDRSAGDWVRVWLPVQPNGSRGWVRAGDVRVVGDPWRLAVRRAAHRVDVFHFGHKMASLPVAIGQSDTPTPGGRFYLLERVRLADPWGPYGPWAFGLSGFSETLTSFNGQQPVIALHGTNDPSSIGRDVSHGCIRLHNDDITALVRLLPLGTPVDILA